VIVVAIVAALAVIGATMLTRRRAVQNQRTRLRQKFGPEYDRLAESGDDGRATAELAQREQLRSRLDIVPLSPEDRDHYRESWHAVQQQFVDEPSIALRRADSLVAEVMRKRGYPLDDFEQRAADVSVDHPQVVENYRAAHAISLADVDNQATTEDLRQAMVHYRALFDELLETRETAGRSA
jgi:hypothetical protein